MQLDIGSRVQTRDGQTAGKIKHIIFDSDRMSVREFVMRTGVLRPSERIVDLQLIEAIDADKTVTIKVTADEVDELPVFVPAVHQPIFYSDLHHATELGVIRRPGSVPRDAVVLGRGSQVHDVNGEHLGHLDEIIFDDTGRARAFVVDAGFLFDRENVVPVEAVDSITRDRIDLRVVAGELEPARAA